MLHEAQEELKNLRNKTVPNATSRRYHSLGLFPMVRAACRLTPLFPPPGQQGCSQEKAGLELNLSRRPLVLQLGPGFVWSLSLAGGPLTA